MSTNLLTDEELFELCSRLDKFQRLQADARRYRWLVKTAPEIVCAVTYRIRAACVHGNPNTCIDAAMKGEEV